MLQKRESSALHLTCRTQKETLKLKHMQASEFAMPNFFLARYLVHTIEMLGCANLSSTGYGESSHKALKGAFASPTSTIHKPLMCRYVWTLHAYAALLAASSRRGNHFHLHIII